MRIPILRGRGLSVSDTANTQMVAVIDAAAARKYWPHENPIGKRIRYFAGENEMGPWLTIVGIAGSVKHVSMVGPPSPTVYIPLDQFPYPGMELVVRTSRDPAELASTVRAATHAVRPDVPVVGVRPAQEIVEEATWRQRFAAQLIGVFAALALIMAVVGAYGVILYSVSQRLNEFGIRIALGAGRNDILAMVLREGFAIAGTGIVVGWVASWALARTLRTLLFAVSPVDTVTFHCLCSFHARNGVARELLARLAGNESRSDDGPALRIGRTGARWFTGSNATFFIQSVRKEDVSNRGERRADLHLRSDDLEKPDLDRLAIQQTG